jgi:Na+-transporting NADH:ubiquinone oxidoreductase subunit NqrB
VVRLGELVAAVSGLGLLVVSFLPWYSAGGENATAWQAFSVVDLFIAAAAVAGLAVGIVVLFRLSVSYPVAGCAVAALFGVIALVLVLIRLLDPPGEGLDLEYGAWLGLVCSAGVTVGGYLGMQDQAAVRTSTA